MPHDSAPARTSYEPAEGDAPSAPSGRAVASPFSPIEEILDEVRAGRMVVICDAEDRENEGDLMLGAQFVSPEAISFMLREAAGYLFICLTERDCDRLDLHPQAPRNTSVRGTPLTVSIDGHPKHGFTTGVSAYERARTIRMAIDPGTGAEDFVRPGHINPLRSRDGGVLVRVGHTEAMVDLCRMAGITPAAVGIEIMKPDGHMARVPDLERFCGRHEMKMCTIAQIIEHRLQRERLVRRLEPLDGTPIETKHGTFTLVAYESLFDPQPQLALTYGDVGRRGADGHPVACDAPTLVRMHRRNLLGDIFGVTNTSPEGATGALLHGALREIAMAGRGALVYLRPEGTGLQLDQRLTAIRRSRVEDAPDFDSSDINLPREHRDFGVGGQILRDLGLSKLRILTNHPKAMPGLEAFGLEIVEHVPLRLTE